MAALNRAGEWRGATSILHTDAYLKVLGFYCEGRYWKLWEIHCLHARPSQTEQLPRGSWEILWNKNQQHDMNTFKTFTLMVISSHDSVSLCVSLWQNVLMVTPSVAGTTPEAVYEDISSCLYVCLWVCRQIWATTVMLLKLLNFTKQSFHVFCPRIGNKEASKYVKSVNCCCFECANTSRGNFVSTVRTITQEFEVWAVVCVKNASFLW